MSNRPNFRSAAQSSFSYSSSAVLDREPESVERSTRPATVIAREWKPAPPVEIWGQFNNYRSNGLAWSVAIHIVLLGLILASVLFGHKVVQQIQQRETVTLIAPSLDSYALPVSKQVASGGGGGGDQDKLPAPKGKLPKLAPQQITPPEIIVPKEHPKLAVEATAVAPPRLRIAENNIPNLGAPAAAPLPSAPPSNGTGSGGGIGSGSGGGIGVGHGPGVGEGSGGGIGGGVYKVGGGITAPQAISTPDPVYTQAARDAKTQGTCVLWMIVDDQGRPRDIRVVRGLGFGLDQKAIEAVQQWRFQPAMKDGHPVNVQIKVEVGFRLY